MQLPPLRRRPHLDLVAARRVHPQVAVATGRERPGEGPLVQRVVRTRKNQYVDVRHAPEVRKTRKFAIGRRIQHERAIHLDAGRSVGRRPDFAPTATKQRVVEDVAVAPRLALQRRRHLRHDFAQARRDDVLATVAGVVVRQRVELHGDAVERDGAAGRQHRVESDGLVRVAAVRRVELAFLCGQELLRDGAWVHAGRERAGGGRRPLRAREHKVVGQRRRRWRRRRWRMRDSAELVVGVGADDARIALKVVARQDAASVLRRGRPFVAGARLARGEADRVVRRARVHVVAVHGRRHGPRGEERGRIAAGRLAPRLGQRFGRRAVDDGVVVAAERNSGRARVGLARRRRARRWRRRRRRRNFADAAVTPIGRRIARRCSIRRSRAIRRREIRFAIIQLCHRVGRVVDPAGLERIVWCIATRRRKGRSERSVELRRGRGALGTVRDGQQPRIGASGVRGHLDVLDALADTLGNARCVAHRRRRGACVPLVQAPGHGRGAF